MKSIALSTVCASGIVLAACALGKTEGQASKKPVMQDFIGMNTHTVQMKPELYKPVTSLLRNYHPVEWDLSDNPSNVAEFPWARNRVNWNELYGKWAKDGYEVNASIMFESIKPDKWKNISKDAYEYGRSFARYFGPSGNVKSVKAIEIGNEPTEWDDARYREMFEAMAKGIRDGDPKMLISTCAVAIGKEDKYSKDIAILKGLEKYIDVLNVHVYSFAEHWPTWKRNHPEYPKIVYLKQVQGIIDWRNKNAPHSKIWITEFGYDSTTKPNLPSGDFAKWVGVTDTQQAQWLVRSFLVFTAMDVDRAYMYWFNDDDKPTLHAASGLTRNYQPKPSFYAQAHLLKSLTDYRYEKTLLSKEGDAYAYQFAQKSGADKVVVAWSPTGSNRAGALRIPMKGFAVNKAEKMPLKEGTAESAKATIDSSGNLTCAIDESPTYIWLQPK